MSSLLHQNYIKSTVQIKSNWIAHATGFIVWIKHEKTNLYYLYLVTNLHVIYWLKEITIVLNKKWWWIWEEKFIINDSRVNFNSIDWYNWNLDIAATIINATYLKDNNYDYENYFIADDYLIKTRKEYINLIETWEEVFLLWYPLWINWINQNSPIARQWIISRIDDDLLNNYNIYLDINNFPWNSWWPILTKPSAIAFGWKELTNSSNLIWIISSYIPYRKTYFDNKNWQYIPSMVMEENSWIAIWFPSYVIYEKLKQNLDQIVEKNPNLFPEKILI